MLETHKEEFSGVIFYIHVLVFLHIFSLYLNPVKKSIYLAQHKSFCVLFLPLKLSRDIFGSFSANWKVNPYLKALHFGILSWKALQKGNNLSWKKPSNSL